ncbi:SURF1-like protein [Cellulomonas algicola]|uniref:SURF1-like protein n=2 Tax=Cellulomonas TaxID=1707 RepID=A0A401V266_9CELL|nr:SURF1 family protein [Cellulomonas algicola]GCD20986.1 SURF1-like protein [Cellulomonas algicola]
MTEQEAPTTTWWQAARRPRMLLLLVVLLGAAAVCGRLGAWQLDRAEVRGARAEARHVAEQVAADPVPLDDVLAPQTAFHGDMVGKKVSVTGTYDTSGQLLVPGRAHDDVTGYLVLTPLHVPGAGSDGGEAVLPVVRGWVGSPADADAPPAGVVDLVGYLQVSEAAGSGVHDGQTDAISSPELLNVWGGPIWTGYLVVASSAPAQSPDVVLLDPPRSPGAGLNIQNLAYAAQWWIFGGFAVALWWRLVRDEAAGDRRLPEDEGEPGPESEPALETTSEPEPAEPELESSESGSEPDGGRSPVA